MSGHFVRFQLTKQVPPSVCNRFGKLLLQRCNFLGSALRFFLQVPQGFWKLKGARFEKNMWPDRQPFESKHFRTCSSFSAESICSSLGELWLEFFNFPGSALLGIILGEQRSLSCHLCFDRYRSSLVCQGVHHFLPRRQGAETLKRHPLQRCLQRVRQQGEPCNLAEQLQSWNSALIAAWDAKTSSSFASTVDFSSCGFLPKGCHE